MKVEIWSDIVCPWCYIGKRRFETALSQFKNSAGVEVVWRSFELDPNAPKQRQGTLSDLLASKYGLTREQAQQSNARMIALAAGEGLAYRLDVAKPGNTLDGHRLIHLAAGHGLQGAAKERLLAAYFTEGQAVGDTETLVQLASEVGLDPVEARAVVEGDAYVDAVRADEQEAAELGINGVPFFVIDRRYGVSGAQPAEVLLQALEQGWKESHPIQRLTPVGGDAQACEDDCPI